MSSIYQQLGDKQGHYSSKFDELSEEKKRNLQVIGEARQREQERLREVERRKNVRFRIFFFSKFLFCEGGVIDRGHKMSHICTVIF